MKFLLLLVLLISLLCSFVHSTRRPLVDPCEVFEELEFRVKSFHFTKQDFVTRKNSLKRMEFALIRAIRNESIDRDRITHRALFDLASTSLPDPGSRIVDDITKILNHVAISVVFSRHHLWKSIRKYSRAFQSFTPVVRQIVYAKLSVHVRRLIHGLQRQMFIFTTENDARMARIRAQKSIIKSCFETRNRGLEEAKNFAFRQLSRWGMLLSRIRYLYFVLSTKVCTDDGEEKEGELIEAACCASVEKLAAFRGNDHDIPFDEEIARLSREFGGNICPSYLRAAGKFRDSVTTKLAKKRSSLEEQIELIQSVIDSNTLFLERLDEF